MTVLTLLKDKAIFIVQVLCYFHQLTSAVKYRLFQSFSTSRELWQL